MAEGREEFIRQLEELGCDLLPVGTDLTKPEKRVVMSYRVPGGRFAEQQIKLGFEVPAEFPRTPPSGPHISPRLLPINPNASDHPNKVLESPPFGSDWEYWSRPYPKWRGREGVSEYLTHIDHLFRTT